MSLPLPPRPSRRAQPALVSAIVIRIGIIVTAGLALVSALTIVALNSQLLASADTKLTTASHAIDRLAPLMTDGQAVDEARLSALAPVGVIFVIVGGSDSVLAEIGGPAVDGTSLLAAASSVRSGERRSVELDGTPLRIAMVRPDGLSLRISVLNGPPQPVSRVIIGVDMTASQETVGTVTAVTAGMVGASAIVLTLGAWYTTRRALRPLSEMSGAASRIAAGDSVARLDEETRFRETRALAAAMNGALDARSSVDASLREFVADLTHELRAPLTTIQGWAELALQVDDAPRGLAALEQIEVEAGRMRSLIDSLALLARLDARPQFAREHVDVRQLVQDVVDRARELYPEAALDYAQPASGRAPAAPEALLFIDRGQLVRVVRNLIGNSLQHAGPSARTVVTVASRVDGVEITVADDGIGISAEGLSKVFDRFYTTAPPGSPNSGLGLAIVRSIAEADGGSVSIESPHRRGTTVSVFFPAIRG